MPRFLLSVLFFLSIFLVFAATAAAQWKALGPFGGDVRSLAADPVDFSRVFLGTSNAQLYASADGGRSWKWLAEISDRHDHVLDSLIIDAIDGRVMYAGAWSVATGGGGGVFKSLDGGRTWRRMPGMASQSVRALVQWQKDPRVLIAGTLEGVFRTLDGGNRWQRISPAYHEEIRNIESVAVDPTNADVIYAGTWHLPWKTADGGRTWDSVKAGIIDDSDIFSIAIDWSNPKTVYASACSGIYRSDSAGALWRKIQGIPYSARRTRVIRQDPRNPNVVYAGTTEGLWKTESRGASWRRTTSPRLIVNDVVIDPNEPSRVLLATDRAGVLDSSDGGDTFRAANDGFAHRRVSRVSHDPSTGRIFVGVLHDKEYGGVFESADGREWRQLSSGLDERDITALFYARVPQGGRLLAGLRDGLLSWDTEKQTWERAGRLIRIAAAPPPRPASKTTHARRQRAQAVPTGALRSGLVSDTGLLRAAVNDFFQAAPDQPLYAATSDGVLRSDDAGLTWRHTSSSRFNATAIAAEGKMLVAGTPTGIDLSFNGGAFWFHVYLPAGSDMAHTNAIAVSGKTMFVATEAGLFRSIDQGASWERKGRGVPYAPVTGVRIRPDDPREVYVTARATGVVYVSRDGGRTFQEFEREGLVGSRFRGLEVVSRNGDGPQLVVASGFDGLFARPLIIAAATAADEGSQ